jgi:hypothetical protein
VAGWDSTLIEQIHAQKQREKSEDRDNLLKLVSRSLYGEAIHYALELIQNAEDEGSSVITFLFGANEAVVSNDGRPFDEDDVWGICSVRTGRKRRKIGFFGIGFKAVFNVTGTPQVISGKYNFELHDFIYPKPLSSVPETAGDYYSSEKGAVFVLPYSPQQMSGDTLVESFTSLDENLLLFLDNLRTLNFANRINGAKWSITKNSEDLTGSLPGSLRRNTKSASIILKNSSRESVTAWKVFHRTLSVKDPAMVPEGKKGVEETRITIAFPLNSEIRDKTKKEGVVYCYLPTKKRTDLPFLIQADFLPTVGRENVSEESRWNVWLMEELGRLAAVAIDLIKNDEQLSGFVYDFIPLSDEIHDPLIRHLYNELFDSLKQMEIAWTAKVWVTPEDCAVPNNAALRGILTEPDLSALLGKKVAYIDSSLSAPDGFTRAENVLFELGSKKIEGKEIVSLLEHEPYIRKKSEKWFLDLYDYLSSLFDTSKKVAYADFPWAWDEDVKALFVRLQKAAFVFTNDRQLVPLKADGSDDRLICYPQNIDLLEVHKLFDKGEIIFLNRYFQESGITHRKEEQQEREEKRKRVKDWFDSVGVRKYVKQSHIIRDVILPKFRSGRYKEYDDSKVYGLLNYIRCHWSTVENEIQNKKLSPEILQEVKDSVLVKAYSVSFGKEVIVYKKPGEVYFSRRYGKNQLMEDLFRGIDGIYFLSPYYLKKERKEAKKQKKEKQKAGYSWKKFFDLLGVWGSPRVVKDKVEVSIAGSEQYPWVQREYSARGWHELHGDSRSEDVERLIEFCSKTEDGGDARARMVLLWQSLDSNWKFYKDNGFCRSTYKFFSYGWNNRAYDTSSFLEFVRTAKWVPTLAGDFAKPGQLTVHSQKNVYLLGENIAYLEFPANDGFLEDLKAVSSPSVDQVLKHLKAFRERNAIIGENQVAKMATIYDFLRRELAKPASQTGDKHHTQETRTVFDDSELFYLPREDRSWWKPCDVFWRDFSESFESLRGYVEHHGSSIYDPGLAEFFEDMGVSQKPSLIDCLAVLDDLKNTADEARYRELAPKVYALIDSMVRQGGPPFGGWDKPVFLTESGQFLQPSEVYFSDDDQLSGYFAGKLAFLWLPFHWSNVKNMLSVGGFKQLSRHVSVVKNMDGLDELEGGEVKRLLERLPYLASYFKIKRFEVYLELEKNAVFARMKSLQCFECSGITLDLTVDLCPDDVSVKGVYKDAYFSVDENRLYKRRDVPILSTVVAKEISRCFLLARDEAFLLLDSLFAAMGYDELAKKLKDFGIDEKASAWHTAEKGVKVLPKTEVPPETDKDKVEVQAEEEKKTVKRVEPPSEIGSPASDLIDPNRFVFLDVLEEYVPYSKTDGPGRAPMTTVNLRKGHYEGAERGYTPRLIPHRGDAESIALELCMRFEEEQGRAPDDRHSQQGIGYDIYSSSDEDGERFIEVKHFRGDPGTWELTPHQWKKAEEQGDKYYVYVVSGLKLDHMPMIQVIRNPVKYLTPDPPVQKKFSDWSNAIINVTKCRKV